MGGSSSCPWKPFLMALVPLEDLLSGGRDKQHPVAVRAGRTYHFDEFAMAASSWRAAFAGFRGQSVALYFEEDSFDFACALFGAWHAGKRVFIPGDALPHTVANLAPRVDGFAGDFPTSTDLIQPRAATAEPWYPLDRTAQALVVYTSGSTGAPVAIEKRLLQLFDEVVALEAAFGSRLGDAFVHATVSHQHIYGLLHRVLWPLATGRPLGAERHAFPESMVAAVLANNPAVLVSSPAHLKRLPEELPWEAVRPRLRAVFSSGGPLPAQALPACRALLGQAPIEIYGSSETGGIAWRQRNDEDDAAWQALPGVLLRIEADTLALCSPHAGGEWETVPDRVRACPGGFELLGRADRVIKIEERRVSLTAMEEALVESMLLQESRAVALEGDRLTIGVVAVPTEEGWALVDRSGKRALASAIRARLASVVDAVALPRHLRLVWALPSDAQGKTRDDALRTLFDARRPDARLVARDGATATLRLTAPRTLPFFEGHFPDLPVLPGVALVEWAVLFGRELFVVPPDFLGIESLKFVRPIVPAMTVTLELAFDRARGLLTFQYASEAGRHAGGRISFGTRQ
jgi:acyl-CoA synthetase (AMP-forming)/AMP-acid ligase II